MSVPGSASPTDMFYHALQLRKASPFRKNLELFPRNVMGSFDRAEPSLSKTSPPYRITCLRSLYKGSQRAPPLVYPYSPLSSQHQMEPPPPSATIVIYDPPLPPPVCHHCAGTCPQLKVCKGCAKVSYCVSTSPSNCAQSKFIRLYTGEEMPNS
jgi:hypothetical protein